MTPPLLWLTWPSPVDEAVLGPVAAVLRSEEAGSTAGRRRGLEGSAVDRAVCRRGNAGAARTRWAQVCTWTPDNYTYLTRHPGFCSLA